MFYVGYSRLELFKREYGVADVKELVAKVVETSTTAITHGWTPHADDTAFLLTMCVNGKECYRVTTASPEDVAGVVEKGVVLVADMNWGKPVERIEVGGVEIVVLDHHGQSGVPTAAEIAQFAVKSGVFKDPKFVAEYLRAVGLHDVGLNAALSGRERQLVGQFLTRPLFYTDEPITKARREETVASAFREITQAVCQKYTASTVNAVIRGAVQELSQTLPLPQHELVRLASAAFSDRAALAKVALMAEGFKVYTDFRPKPLTPSPIDIAVYMADKRLAEEAGRLQIAMARHTVKSVMDAKLAVVQISNRDGVKISDWAIVFERRPHMPELVGYIIHQIGKEGYLNSRVAPKYVIMPNRDGSLLAVKSPIDTGAKVAQIGGNVYLVEKSAVKIGEEIKVKNVIQGTLNTPQKIRV